MAHRRPLECLRFFFSSFALRLDKDGCVRGLLMRNFTAVPLDFSSSCATTCADCGRAGECRRFRRSGRKQNRGVGGRPSRSICDVRLHAAPFWKSMDSRCGLHALHGRRTDVVAFGGFPAHRFHLLLHLSATDFLGFPEGCRRALLACGCLVGLGVVWNGTFLHEAHAPLHAARARLLLLAVGGTPRCSPRTPAGNGCCACDVYGHVSCPAPSFGSRVLAHDGL